MKRKGKVVLAYRCIKIPSKLTKIKFLTLPTYLKELVKLIHKAKG